MKPGLKPVVNVAGVRKTANVLNELPKAIHGKAKAGAA